MQIIINNLNLLKCLTHALIHAFENRHIMQESWDSGGDDDLMFKQNYRVWCTCGFNWKGNK